MAALTLVGCDAVFGTALPVDADLDVLVEYNRCTPQAETEDPLRYHVLANPNVVRDATGSVIGVEPWPWDQAREDCRRFGMDLVVLNDARELGRVSEEFPYWIGHKLVSGNWRSEVDDCTPFTNDSVGRMGMECGVVEGPLLVNSANCDAATIPPMPPETEPQLINHALCEALRPSTESCLAKDPNSTVYTVSQEPLSRAAAQTFCNERGAQLVEIDSHAEWLRVGRLTRDRQRRYWMGVTFDGTEWKTESSCPMLYSWVGNNVEKPVATGSCLATELAPDVLEGGLRLDGVRPEVCTETASVFALCEQ